MTRQEALTRDGILPYLREVLINEIFDEHEAQLRAKDDAIELLESMCNLGLETQDKYIRIVKAKDEEIKRLEQQSSDLFLTYLLDEKRQDAKARSIVAMLFWEWKRYIRINLRERGVASYILFDKAYKILKECK